MRVKENEEDGWDQEGTSQENYSVNLSRKAEQKSMKRQVYLLLAHCNLTPVMCTFYEDQGQQCP
jgi:hypothetical protein